MSDLLLRLLVEHPLRTAAVAWFAVGALSAALGVAYRWVSR